MTNSEIYQIVVGFATRYEQVLPSLEEYLRSLWQTVSQSPGLSRAFYVSKPQRPPQASPLL